MNAAVLDVRQPVPVDWELPPHGSSTTLYDHAGRLRQVTVAHVMSRDKDGEFIGGVIFEATDSVPPILETTARIWIMDRGEPNAICRDDPWQWW